VIFKRGHSVWEIVSVFPYWRSFTDRVMRLFLFTAVLPDDVIRYVIRYTAG